MKKSRERSVSKISSNYKGYVRMNRDTGKGGVTAYVIAFEPRLSYKSNNMKCSVSLSCDSHL